MAFQQPCRDRDEILSDRINAIHSMLMRLGLGEECAACHSPCRSVREICVDHPEFCLTVPLRICRRCSVVPPFPPEPFTNRWRVPALTVLPAIPLVIGGAKVLAVAYLSLIVSLFILRSRRRVPKVRTIATLQQLVATVPEYRQLVESVPGISLSCQQHSELRDSIDGTEADRFASTVHIRCRRFVLTNAHDLQRSGILDIVLVSYFEIIDTQIKRVVEETAGQEQLVVQLAAVLLPGRQWRFDTQVVTASRTRQHQLQERLVAALDSLPAWPVSYPVVFGMRRAFANPPEGLTAQLRAPFEGWAARVKLPDPISYSEMSLRVYEIKLPEGPVGFDVEDSVALRERLPESVPLRLLHADLLRVTEQFDQALEIYDALIDEFPDDASIVYQRISCLVSAGQLERAAAACQQRMSQHPQEEAAYGFLADLQLNLDHPADALGTVDRALDFCDAANLFQLRGVILAVLGRFSEALSAANTAIFQDRNCAPAYLLRAKLHRHDGQREAALADLDQFHRCAGKTLESLALQADLFLGLGRTGNAEQAYHAAIQESPQNLKLKLQWGEFLARRGKLESARQQCDQVIQSAGEFHTAYSVRAAISLDMGQFDEAVRDADEAIRLGANDPRTYLVRGIAKSARGELDHGLEDLDLCIEMAPDYALARLHRGRLRLSLQEYETAVHEFSAALEIDPNWTDALIERGYAYLGDQQHEKAREDFEQVLRISPARADAYTGRAITHLIAGRKAAASDDLNKALALDPNDLRGRLQRARLLLEQHETELAKEDLNAVLAMQPHLEPALWHRAHLHLRLGEFSKARQDFDRLIDIHPDQPHSLIGRSVAFELAGDLTNAEADREEAHRLAPFSADELTISQTLLLASVASSNEQFDKAIELATKIIDEQPDPPCDAYRIRGHARWYSEDVVGALEDYSHILEHGEEATRHDFSAYGQVLGELGEFERGLEALDRSIEIAREQDDLAGLAFSMNGRGRVLAGLGRRHEAEEAFAESLKLKPDNAWLHFNRGMMYFESNEPTRALTCFELALCVHSPKLPPAKRRRVSGFIQRMQQARDALNEESTQ